MKSWFHDSGIEMYSMHNKGNSVVAEIFMRTLQNKVYEHVTVVSKNVYNKLDETVDKYNNTTHIIKQ